MISRFPKLFKFYTSDIAKACGMTNPQLIKEVRHRGLDLNDIEQMTDFIVYTKYVRKYGEAPAQKSSDQ